METDVSEGVSEQQWLVKGPDLQECVAQGHHDDYKNL